MSDRHEELLELCAGYALGSLADDERERLEAHLDTGCAECRAALADFSGAVTVLAASAPAVAPPAAVRQRVLEAVAAAERDPGPSPVTPRSTRLPWVAAAGWALAAAAGIALFVQGSELDHLGDELARARGDRESAERQLAEERQWEASMASPASRVAFLAATPDADQGLAGWALYDPASRRAIVVLENVTLESGHDYELWGLGDSVRSLGVIRLDATGRALVRLPVVEAPAGIRAIAVSKEPKGGSPDKSAPSGPVVLVGDLTT